MYFIAKIVIMLILSLAMQTGTESIVSTTPREAVNDFMDGLAARDTMVMEKYMDDAYVNFIMNVKGDRETIEKMNEALFSDFSYDIEKIAVKDDLAVAKVIVTSRDFSGVKKAYDRASYSYVVDNLYSDEVGDKEQLAAKCLEIYVGQIEKAAESGKTVETTVFIPMADDGHYGWNIMMTDDLMSSVLGNLQIPQ